MPCFNMTHPISKLQAGQPTASLREKLGSPASDRTLVSKKGVINNNKNFATTKKKNTYHKTAHINLRAPK